RYLALDRSVRATGGDRDRGARRNVCPSRDRRARAEAHRAQRSRAHRLGVGATDAQRRESHGAGGVAPTAVHPTRNAGLSGWARDRKLTVTEDEVRSLVAEGTRAGVFMPKEREMIEGVLRLADRTVRAIMTPRTEVAWLEANATPPDIVAQLDARRLSRYPV